MFRKPGAKRAQAARQRKESSSGEESSDDGEVVKESLAKRRRKNPMVQSTKKDEGNKRTRNSSSSSSSDDDRRDEFAFKASGVAAPAGPKDMGATATLDIDTEKERDARTQFERIQKELGDDGEAETDAAGRTLYRGLARYGAKKAQDTSKGNAGSGTNRLGPVRAPQFLRQTVRWDFAPDICKDFKETGFCTFGDSCKFMHDRGDYKHGWELERDFEQGKADAEQNYEISDDEDEFPDCCPVCEQPFVNPVVTRCKHYLCERCAITAFKKSKKCKVCDENTGGVFNIAKELVAHLKGEGSKKKKMNEEEEEEIEESDENEDEKVEDMKMEDAEGEEEGDGERQIKVEEEEEEGGSESGSEGAGEDEKEEEIKQEEEENEEEGVEMEIENEVVEEEDGGENVSDEEEYDEGEETDK